MSELIRCPKCEIPYLPGEAEFCGNCGTELPLIHARPRIRTAAQFVEHVDDLPHPYAALRFVSGVIITGGWLIIICGWIAILFWWTMLNATFQQVPGVSVNGTVLVEKVSPVILIAAGLINTLAGVIVIGMGQVYAVILDIRDDMNATMQYVRFGLKKSKL